MTSADFPSRISSATIRIRKRSPWLIRAAGPALLGDRLKIRIRVLRFFLLGRAVCRISAPGRHCRNGARPP